MIMVSLLCPSIRKFHDVHAARPLRLLKQVYSFVFALSCFDLVIHSCYCVRLSFNIHCKLVIFAMEWKVEECRMCAWT